MKKNLIQSAGNKQQMHMRLTEKEEGLLQEEPSKIDSSPNSASLFCFSSES